MTRKSNQFIRYLPVSDANLQWGLYLTGAGSTDIPPHRPYPPAGHPELYDFSWETGRILPEFQLIFISGGSGEFESRRTGSLPVPSGTVILLFPDTWHRYRPNPETGWSESWISVNGALLFALTTQGLMSPDRPLLHPRTTGAITDNFSRLFARLELHAPHNRLSLAADALSILAAALEDMTAAATAPGDALQPADAFVQRALDTIHEFSYRDMSVPHLAQQLGVTPRTLQRRFAEARGRTVSEEISHSRVERARRLLRETRMSVKQVAFASGFTSPDRMTKVFRRLTGKTPSAYRASLAKNTAPRLQPE